MSYPLVTPEEIEELYEFVVLKKVLMRTYPWIKDVKIPPKEKINDYSIIFLDIVIDPWMLAKEKDWKVKWFVRMGEFGRSPYLSTLYNKKEEPRAVTEELGDLMDKIHRSPAIPREFKLPGKREFMVGSYDISPDSTPLPEYQESWMVDS